MSGVFQKVDTVNKTVRTVILTGFLGLFGFGCFLGYDRLIKPNMDLDKTKKELNLVSAKFKQTMKELEQSQKHLQESQETVTKQKTEIAEQKVRIVTLKNQNDKLNTSLRLVKVDRRLAYVTVTRSGINPDTKIHEMEVVFTEVDGKDKPIDKQRVFQLKGDLLNIDTWLVKFEDKYIEDAHFARGSTLCIINGIKGNLDRNTIPIDKGIPNESPNDDDRPGVYKSMGKQTPQEMKIWKDFWEVANDTEKQKELGIRANHGQINYTKVKPGVTYRLDLRASDGATLKKVDNPPKSVLPKTRGT